MTELNGSFSVRRRADTCGTPTFAGSSLRYTEDWTIMDEMTKDELRRMAIELLRMHVEFPLELTLQLTEAGISVKSLLEE